jgi:hypothetical protein
MRNKPEKPFQCEKCHKQDCQKNQEHENQIYEKAHPNQHQQAEREKQIIPELIHKRNIIQGEMVIYLDNASTKHFTFLIILKSRILLM